MGLEKFRKEKKSKDVSEYVNTDVIISNTRRYKRKKYNLDTMELNLLDAEFIASKIMKRD